MRRLLTALIACALGGVIYAQGTLTPTPKFTALDDNGLIIASGKLCTYAAGTTTPATTYNDADLAPGHANTNPVVMDSAGRAVVYLAQTSYKFVLYSGGTAATCDGTQIWSQDNITAVPTSSGAVDVAGTAGENLSAQQAVYLSDGSGSKVAGLWYVADAANNYSSTLNSVGMTTAAITSGASGTIRLLGRVTNTSSLTAGALYYVGTSGAIQSAIPIVNPRLIGQADTTTSIVLGDPPADYIPVMDATCGRLTLASGQPVADVTAGANIFYTPDGCDQLSLYDGTRWINRRFSEISIPVPATTSTVYDIWAYDSNGFPALELQAWTNTTTPAATLVLQNGRPVKSGTPTRRFLGVFETSTSSGLTNDDTSQRLLWNLYHQVPRQLLKLSADTQWNYTTATVRQANGSTSNQVEVVTGCGGARTMCRGSVVRLLLQTNASETGAGAVGPKAIAVCFGVNSTTACNASSLGGVGWTFTDPTDSTTGGANPTAGIYATAPLGDTLYQWLEWSTASGTTTWHGTNSGPTNTTSGISGTIDN